MIPRSALHAWRRIVGLTDPRTATIKIECACGHISEAATFAAAAKLHETHQRAATAAGVKGAWV